MPAALIVSDTNVSVGRLFQISPIRSDAPIKKGNITLNLSAVNSTLMCLSSSQLIQQFYMYIGIPI